MDRLESNKASNDQNNSEQAQFRVDMRKRKLTMDFFVGVFSLIGVGALAYLSVGLGGLEITPTGDYRVIAEFDNISGLQLGASVEIAGVQIGNVRKIELSDPAAKVTLEIDHGVPIYKDDIASIRTKGIIGDRYVKLTRGPSLEPVTNNQRLFETESVIDIEDIVGKFVHSLGSDKDKDKENHSNGLDKITE